MRWLYRVAGLAVSVEVRDHDYAGILRHYELRKDRHGQLQIHFHSSKE